MVRWLIEYQHIYTRIDQLRQCESALLAARQIPNVLVNVVASEKKFRQERTQFAGSRARRRNSSQFHDDLVSIIEVVELLGVVTYLDFRTPANFAGEWRRLFQNCF